MEMNMLKVTVCGEVKEYPYGTPYAEIVDAYQNTVDAPVILVVANGKLRELHKKLKRDTHLELITVTHSIGYKTYKRSACLILQKALYDVIGRNKLEKVIIHYSIGSGYYFTIKGDVNLNQELLEQVKSRMREMVDAKTPIIKRTISTDEAIARFHEHGMYDKEKLFKYRIGSKVNIYSIGNYEDYFYGYMANHAGMIPYFDLKLYDEGFVLELPEQKEPGVIPEFAPQEKIFQVQKESQEWIDKLNISCVGELNDRIVKEGIQNILLIQEALQESKIARIAEQIIASDDKKFVMIAGPSSSGKTTFSHRLCIQLAAHGKKPHAIAVDNYFLNREDTPFDEFGERDYECLGAIDLEGFNRDMLALLEGKRVELPVYNFKTGTREYHGNELQLGKEDLLVIEGIHGLNDKLSYALPKESKFKIYISALTQLNIDEHNRIPTTDGRLIRRIVRDARTRNLSAKATIAMWPSVRRGEEKNIFPFQEDADVMFNSALVYELACLKVYAEPLLFGIGKEEPEYLEAKRLLKFFDYFLSVPADAIPQNSILREFVGGSCFSV